MIRLIQYSPINVFLTALKNMTFDWNIDEYCANTNTNAIKFVQKTVVIDERKYKRIKYIFLQQVNNMDRI